MVSLALRLNRPHLHDSILLEQLLKIRLPHLLVHNHGIKAYRLYQCNLKIVKVRMNDGWTTDIR